MSFCRIHERQGGTQHNIFYQSIHRTRRMFGTEFNLLMHHPEWVFIYFNYILQLLKVKAFF